MPHWKLTLSYNGAHFHGWQVQPGLDTVQGRLREAIRQMTGEIVLPQGSGRTDAGVHALAQVCSFTLQAAIPATNLQRALNRILPPGIRVDRADRVPPAFHARHSARRKTYEYRIFERRPAPGWNDTPAPASPCSERICSPFLAPLVWDCRWSLRFHALLEAAALLLGTHDFTAFAAKDRVPHESDDITGISGQNRPHPVKTIFTSEWSATDGLLIYRVCGSGFLHHMVRNLVGTMVDIGRGSLELEDLPARLAGKDRSLAGPTAPASGWYLGHVDYTEWEAAHRLSNKDQAADEEASVNDYRSKV